MKKKRLTRLCVAAPPSSPPAVGLNTLCSSGGVPTPHAEVEVDEEGEDARPLPVGLGEKMRRAAAAAETEGGGEGFGDEEFFDKDMEPCAPLPLLPPPPPIWMGRAAGGLGSGITKASRTGQ